MLGSIIGLDRHRYGRRLRRSRDRAGSGAMSLSEKIGLGMAGSVLGGLLGRVLLHHGRGFVRLSSWIGSIVGSIVVVSIYLQVQQRRI